MKTNFVNILYDYTEINSNLAQYIFDNIIKNFKENLDLNK